MTPENSTSEEKWYTPVDIGQHVDTSYVEKEALNQDHAAELFHKETILTENALQNYEILRDKWLKDNGEEYIRRFADNRAFHLDEDHPVSAEIHRFSGLKAEIHIIFRYGYSRWHQYYIALGIFLIERSTYVDEVFGLQLLEKKYSFSFNGITHDTPVEEVESILGNDYQEYAGQSPQYRNLYYEQHDLEVIIQDERVKYLQKGKPGWIDIDSEG